MSASFREEDETTGRSDCLGLARNLWTGLLHDQAPGGSPSDASRWWTFFGPVSCSLIHGCCIVATNMTLTIPSPLSQFVSKAQYTLEEAWPPTASWLPHLPCMLQLSLHWSPQFPLDIFLDQNTHFLPALHHHHVSPQSGESSSDFYRLTRNRASDKQWRVSQHKVLLLAVPDHLHILKWERGRKAADWALTSFDLCHDRKCSACSWYDRGRGRTCSASAEREEQIKKIHFKLWWMCLNIQSFCFILSRDEQTQNKWDKNQQPADIFHVS